LHQKQLTDKMKNKIKTLLLFIIKFGTLSGLKLTFMFFIGKVKNIKLPNIKYPIYLRKRTSDIPTFFQIFIDEQFDIDIEEKNSSSPQIIIDAGANIGLFAIKMKNQFPDSKIICIEPDIENFQILEKNLSNYDNIFLENSGLWNKDTKLKVYDKYNAGKWGMIVEEDLNTGNINAISVNSLLKKYSIDYIDCFKIDIETSEKQVFSEDYLEWLPKVKMLIIELHDNMESGCSRPFFEAINKTFRNYSYDIRGENTIIINHDLFTEKQ